MDKQSADFIRKHRVSGPFIVACILGFVLYKFAGLSAQASAAIAIGLGVTDYLALSWLLGRAEGGDDDRNIP